MKTLRETRLGDIIKINGKTYIVCVYRNNYHVQLVDLRGNTKLFDINTEV